MHYLHLLFPSRHHLIRLQQQWHQRLARARAHDGQQYRGQWRLTTAATAAGRKRGADQGKRGAAQQKRRVAADHPVARTLRELH